jgi:hypothetical protein
MVVSRPCEPQIFKRPCGVADIQEVCKAVGKAQQHSFTAAAVVVGNAGRAHRGHHALSAGRHHWAGGAWQAAIAQQVVPAGRQQATTVSQLPIRGSRSQRMHPPWAPQSVRLSVPQSVPLIQHLWGKLALINWKKREG